MVKVIIMVLVTLLFFMFRTEQLYQKVMSLWHQLHVNMKSVVSWHYLLKDIRTVSTWNLDTVRRLSSCVSSSSVLCSVILIFSSRVSPPPPPQVRCQSPSERQQVLDHLESQLGDFLSDSKESSLFTPVERRELEKDVQQVQQNCQDLLLNMETGETLGLELGDNSIKPVNVCNKAEVTLLLSLSVCLSS